MTEDMRTNTLKPESAGSLNTHASSLRKLRTAIHKTKSLFILDQKDSRMPINFREGSFAIPVDLLEQKLLLHKGLVMVSQGEYM